MKLKIIRTVYFEYELLQRIQEISKRFGISRSKLVNDAVREYLMRKEKHKK